MQVKKEILIYVLSDDKWWSLCTYFSVHLLSRDRFLSLDHIGVVLIMPEKYKTQK